ncbi:hypothetical protein CSOJ01_11564 [Colletotrichum sojae]|uniref:Uncharacterized protein n=1 Tax=Colletotrichum sojae TaxID=2175907 RepID=A0A8H6MNI2_9PEZI|nr:hypothetical protein CSOJ01_11564 [Colletotrichum sojae]
MSHPSNEAPRPGRRQLTKATDNVSSTTLAQSQTKPLFSSIKSKALPTQTRSAALYYKVQHKATRLRRRSTDGTRPPLPGTESGMRVSATGAHSMRWYFSGTSQEPAFPLLSRRLESPARPGEGATRGRERFVFRGRVAPPNARQRQGRPPLLTELVTEHRASS